MPNTKTTATMTKIKCRLKGRTTGGNWTIYNQQHLSMPFKNANLSIPLHDLSKSIYNEDFSLPTLLHLQKRSSGGTLAQLFPKLRIEQSVLPQNIPLKNGNPNDLCSLPPVKDCLSYRWFCTTTVSFYLAEYTQENYSVHL